MDAAIKWTNLKRRQISELFAKRGMDVSMHVVKQLLDKHGFVKRKMQKTKTMKETKNRNEQFERIYELRAEYEDTENPIISIDVKKKEEIGNFYREGQCYGIAAVEVYDHDFKSFSEGVVIPHGIYDVRMNVGYITLGNSKDISEFCCECIKDWWVNHGQTNYPNATSILALADGGGSNSSRHYIFKEDLQKLVNEIGVEIRIAHYPPYTSKYNPIEHRLFCHVTRACEGVVFSNIEVVQGLVSDTTTSKGLKVFATIKDKIFETGRKVADGFKENMSILFDDFLGQWNYRAVPDAQKKSEVIF
ncbi:MAG: ISAzo13 family transposase [Defluviitaleaceae bacterium]|nr:ISAzo13 family transposase [Defluviitaleaceae bacterium]